MIYKHGTETHYVAFRPGQVKAAPKPARKSALLAGDVGVSKVVKAFRPMGKSAFESALPATPPIPPFEADEDAPEGKDRTPESEDALIPAEGKPRLGGKEAAHDSTKDEPPDVMYHVSSRRKRNSILRNGLLPYHAQEYRDVGHENAVYLFGDLAEAEGWAEEHSQYKQGAVDVWEVRVPDKGSLWPDFEMRPEYTSAWKFPWDVPPGNLRLLKTLGFRKEGGTEASPVAVPSGPRWDWDDPDPDRTGDFFEDVENPHSVQKVAASAKPPEAVLRFAERALGEVGPEQCGNTWVVDDFGKKLEASSPMAPKSGWWVETHTIGCRDAADEAEEEWWDSHYAIYDEYVKDGMSTVLGAPEDGKFVTITPWGSGKVAARERWSSRLLDGLKAEARKAPTFGDFRHDFLIEIKHGLYFHVTDDPDFAIDPAKGPRDMSSMADGTPSPGKLMVTSHLENWLANYGKSRPWVAVVDMSRVPRDAYRQVKRGFGNEFIVDDPSQAKVAAVLPVAKARALDRRFDGVLDIQGDDDLKEFYDMFHFRKRSDLKAFSSHLEVSPASQNPLLRPKTAASVSALLWVKYQGQTYLTKPGTRESHDAMLKRLGIPYSDQEANKVMRGRVNLDYGNQIAKFTRSGGGFTPNDVVEKAINETGLQGWDVQDEGEDADAAQGGGWYGMYGSLASPLLCPKGAARGRPKARRYVPPPPTPAEWQTLMRNGGWVEKEGRPLPMRDPTDLHGEWALHEGLCDPEDIPEDSEDELGLAEDLAMRNGHMRVDADVGQLSFQMRNMQNSRGILIDALAAMPFEGEVWLEVGPHDRPNWSKDFVSTRDAAGWVEAL
jgi:hypothetical protein